MIFAADQSSLPDLAQANAQRLFPPDVKVCATYPWEDPDDLLPEERASLPNAIDSRLREFAAGRRASHMAMIEMRSSVRAIPSGRDRAPKWPRGVAGSISHTDEICLAALGSASVYRTMGIDVEEDADLPPDILPEICTPSEFAWLSIQPETIRGRLARLIFSAKECAFKCQYPISKTLVGFDAFEITPDIETGQFEATFTLGVPGFPERSCIAGRFTIADGLIITGMTFARTR